MGVDQEVSSADLAQQFGGVSTPPPGGASSADLAQQFGGTSEAPPRSTMTDAAIGVAKGAGETLTNLGSLVHKIPGVDAAVDWLYGTPGLSKNAFAEARKVLAPTNTPQTIGKGAEQIAETLVPAAKISAAAKGLKLIPRMLAEAAGNAAIAEGQGGDPAIAGALGAAVPLVGAAARGAGRFVAGARTNPVVADAVEWGLEHGAPVDPATATGNKFLRGAQAVATKTTPGGALVGQAAQRKSADWFTQMGGKLADRAAPAPATMESTGHDLVQALKGNIATHSQAADEAYSALRAIEADPAHATPVTSMAESPVLDASGQPFRSETTTNVPLAVDLRDAQKRLQPVYDELKQQNDLVGLEPDKKKSFLALDRLMNAGDHAPLSVADGALSDLKALARRGGSLRTRGQGIAAKAVNDLGEAVMATAQEAGPDAVDALNAGRAATKAKYVTADILDSLQSGTNGEPVKAAARLVAPNDTRVAQLRELAKEAPDQMPKVGRAVLEGLFDTATQEGGFDKTGSLLQQWNKLGDETKRVIFDPSVNQDVGRFLTLAKQMSENPNPSGTATTALAVGSMGLLFTNPASGAAVHLGAPAVAALLTSPATSKLLTRGLQLSTRTRSGLANARALADALMKGGEIEASRDFSQ